MKNAVLNFEIFDRFKSVYFILVHTSSRKTKKSLKLNMSINNSK